jgi:hypothetical protein
MSKLGLRRTIRSFGERVGRAANCLLLAAGTIVFGGDLHAQQVTLALRTPGVSANAIDVGPVDSSMPIQITVNFALPPERSAALDRFLASLLSPSSPEYRQWLTPKQFATQFGATDLQVATVTAWLTSQGLSVGAVSPGGTRLAVSGSAAQVQTAFGVALHQYRLGAQTYFANTGAASLPAALTPMIASVGGLTNLGPDQLAAGATVTGVSPGVALALEPSAQSGDMLAVAGQAIDTNVQPVLVLSSAACATDFVQADYDAYTTLLRQANAQGITVLATSGCGAASFPASLVEVTSVTAPDTATAAGFAGIDTRPAWQRAPGLPAGTMRVAPDVTATSTSALAQTLATISQQASVTQLGNGRLGNINATLYALGPEPGLYTQPDVAPAGTWEASTGLGLVDLTTLANAFPRGVTSSATSLLSSSYSVTHGQSFTLTATVTGNGSTPTGTIIFSSTQGGQLATVPLVNGIATTSTNQLSGGAYSLTASYSGDATFAASTSNVATVTILPEAATLTATASAGATYGGNMTVNATVSSTSGVGTPTQIVTVQPQGTTVNGTFSGTLTSTGVTNAPATATVTLPVPEGGAFTLLVTCSGDANFTCYTPYTLSVTAAPSPSTTALALSPTAPVVGSTFTMTATVAKTATIVPTGTVQFFDGTTLLNAAGLGNGTASYTTTFSTGTHNYTAVYSGDTNYAASTSPAQTPTGGPVSTTTSVNSSIYGVTYGQPFTLAATVQPASTVNNTPPTGTVTFTAAAQGVLGTAPVTNGTASLALPGTLAVGTYVISANYGGDTSYAASASPPSAIVTISQAQASIAATLSPASIPLGGSATLTVAVTLPYPAASPTGNVTATVNGIAGAVYTAALTAATGGAATATIPIPAPPNAGSYTVQVTCAGSAAFQCPTPGLATLTVGGMSTGNTVTTTQLSVSPLAPLAGQPVNLTATIASATGSPTGTVTFFDNGTAIAKASVVNKQATAIVTLAAGASQSLTAIYSGDATFSSSTSPPIVVNVTSVPSSIALTSSVSHALRGASILFTASVGSGSAGVAPTGTVSFIDTFNGSTAAIGSASLVATGAGFSATQISTSGLLPGTHSIVAVYGGDAYTNASTSPALAVAITDYTVTLSPQLLTLTRGQTGTVTLTIAAVGGFSGTINLLCVPPGNTFTTCSISPATVQNSGSATMTIGTTASATMVLPTLGRSDIKSVAIAMLVTSLLLGRRRRLPKLLVALLSLGMVAGLSACGSNSPPPSTVTGSPVGQTLFTIDTSGSDGVTTVTHDAQYQVTLQ